MTEEQRRERGVAAGGVEGPAWTTSPCWVTASVMGECFADGNRNLTSTCISIANNFIFTVVTPSKLPKCIRELPQPGTQRHSVVTCYAAAGQGTR